MKAVFLDRDGVVNEENGYITKWEQFEFIPGSKEAIALLSRKGYKVFVVTNQSGIARGMLSENDLLDIHKNMVGEIETAGGRIDEIYYCGHHPEDLCGCRKPNIAMLQKAAKEHKIDLSKSYMIGDKARDIEAGKRAGCRTVLVRTGHGMNYDGPKPDFVAADLLEAVKIILGNEADSE